MFVKRKELTANQRLRLFLNSENISQVEFSQLTGIEKSKVSNFLKWPKKGGTEFPRIDFFQLIAKAYPKLSMRWLLIGEGEMILSMQNGERTFERLDVNGELVLQLRYMREDNERLRMENDGLRDR